MSGNVWRIDPKNPKLVVVGRVQERDVGGKKVRADVSGIVFNQAGDLFLTAGGFKEVLRIRGRYLDPDEPGDTPTSPVTAVAPTLVTVEPAKTA